MPTADVTKALLVLNNSMNPNFVDVRHGEETPAPVAAPEPAAKDIQQGQDSTPVPDKPLIELEDDCLNDLLMFVIKVGYAKAQPQHVKPLINEAEALVEKYDIEAIRDLLVKKMGEKKAGKGAA